MRPALAIAAVFSLVLAILWPGAQVTQQASAISTHSGSGLVLHDMDTTIRPGDDFFDYVVGAWVRSAQIPADRSFTGVYQDVSDRTDADLQAVVEQAAAAHAASGEVAQKVGDLYAAYMDEATLERKGVEPIRSDLAVVDAATDKRGLSSTLVTLNVGNSRTPFPVSVVIDPNQPTRYVAQVWQGGLTFPNRDYYLNHDEGFVDLREKFVAHVERLLSLAGYADAHQQAEQLLALETMLAEVQWPLDDEDDPQKTKTIMSRAEVERLGADAPLRAIFDGLGLPADTLFQVGMPEVTAKTARLFAGEPLETWKTYLRYHVLAHYSDYLSKSFAEEAFGFYSGTLDGVQQQRPRPIRGMYLASDMLGDAVGQLYVKKTFSPEEHQQAVGLVENFRSAFSKRIAAAAWMAPGTRDVAQAKLAAMLPKVGYPDTWKSYDSVRVSPDDLVGAVKSTEAWHWHDNLAHLGKPIDRAEWDTTPQVVNAYYDQKLNDLTFPAAVLQPPYFDPTADPAVVYGMLASGTFMGHEMSHGFDDQGRQFDAAGALRDWWTPADAARYQREADKLVAQFNAYEPLPGLHVNGQQTLGENIADLAGLQIAYDAYKSSLNGKEAQVIDGFTGDQRFFIAYAAGWRQIDRDEYARDGLVSDVHSPTKYRANGIVRNLDAWYDAFDVKEGDALYLRPEDRVRLW